MAPTYGISDVMLKKICRQMDIPTPPRGYWAKVQNNIRVDKAKLPKLKIGQPTTYWIQENDHVRPKAETEDEKFSEEAIQILRVSPNMLSRALRIFDSIIKYFERQDVPVVVENAHADRLDPLTNGLPFEDETE